MEIIGDKILVKINLKRRTEAGLIIENPEIPTHGEVVGMGEVDIDLKIGDMVRWLPYAGTLVKLPETTEETHYAIIRPNDIFMKFEPSKVLVLN